MYDDVNDTAVLPKDESSIATYDPKLMRWEIKQLDQSSNSSASVSFRLESYRGVAVNSSMNIELKVTLPNSLCTVVLDESSVTLGLIETVNCLWYARKEFCSTSFDVHRKRDSN